MKAEYKNAKTQILKTLEEIVRVKAPVSEYLEALEEIKSEVDDWFEMTIDAAKWDAGKE